ncbi:hypothetical protein TVAG_024350 [Trichomonas vaginalis G3]|uniref:USP domain-containing protein n=1 Tax=Trichomonas vaginalis (strain ATCC PRA-98 / G3) TaxID=412133 RepID=A2FM93_TRIV3|nr:hypothetical protein TVAG_024350 [Trichomonas vaginalis G3]|eukprot:XP_001306921.1 hypothetical protein [Trichomonas vaginalis G3]
MINKITAIEQKLNVAHKRRSTDNLKALLKRPLIMYQRSMKKYIIIPPKQSEIVQRIQNLFNSEVFTPQQRGYFNAFSNAYLNSDGHKSKMFETFLNGITNSGNTCYMNSILSLLANIPKFKYIIYTCDEKLQSDLLTELKILFAKLDFINHPNVTADNIIEILRSQIIDINFSEQQDAQEFILVLLQTILKGAPACTFI